jgi:uncharacterized damage-inducible protein DinB
MLVDHLGDLVGHMEWADALVWKSALALPAVASDVGVRDRLYHMHSVQWAYLQIWRGDPLDIPDLSDFEDLRAVCAWAQEYYRSAPQYLEALDSDALGRRIDFPWAEQLVERWGKVHPATLAQTIQQVASHSTYHRGQVNTRLRELGGEPPLTDFIAWIWAGRPEPVWEDAVDA